MNEQLTIAFYNMIAKVGFDVAFSILKATTNKATIEDAIKALADAQKVGWAEAKVGTI